MEAVLSLLFFTIFSPSTRHRTILWRGWEEGGSLASALLCSALLSSCGQWASKQGKPHSIPHLYLRAPAAGMEWLEKNLQEKFDLPPKNRSEEALRRWRDAVSVVKNPRRRFRMVADLASRQQNELKRRSVQVPYPTLPYHTLPCLLLLLLFIRILLLMGASLPAAAGSPQPPLCLLGACSVLPGFPTSLHPCSSVLVPCCSHEGKAGSLLYSLHLLLFRCFSPATSFSSPPHLNRSNSHFPLIN